MPIQIEITGQEKLKEVINSVSSANGRLKSAIGSAANSFANDVLRNIKEKYLSGPRPEKLGVKSEMLRARTIYSIDQSGNNIQIKWGNNLPYGRIHEYGGRTSAHTILPKRKDILSFIVNGKRVYTKRVNHPGSVIRKRPYLRPGLEDLLPEFRQKISDMVTDIANGAFNGK